MFIEKSTFYINCYFFYQNRTFKVYLRIKPPRFIIQKVPETKHTEISIVDFKFPLPACEHNIDPSLYVSCMNIHACMFIYKRSMIKRNRCNLIMHA